MTDRHTTSLLELDPDLGQLLPDERLSTARRDLRVAVRTVETGPWEVERLSGASPEHLGLLVVEGIVAREVLVSDTISTELLGPGDVVRPWRIQDGSTLLRHTVRWNVLTRSRFALLDRRLSAELGRYPEIGAAIVDRVNERALRLALTQAISQLNRVDRRLLALFWHLAERWGRMTADGVALPMTLSHRMLGQLVGARRPTVSTALSDLVARGRARPSRRRHVAADRRARRRSGAGDRARDPDAQAAAAPRAAGAGAPPATVVALRAGERRAAAEAGRGARRRAPADARAVRASGRGAARGVRDVRADRATDRGASRAVPRDTRRAVPVGAGGRRLTDHPPAG